MAYVRLTPSYYQNLVESWEAPLFSLFVGPISEVDEDGYLSTLNLYDMVEMYADMGTVSFSYASTWAAWIFLGGSYTVTYPGYMGITIYGFIDPNTEEYKEFYFPLESEFTGFTLTVDDDASDINNISMESTEKEAIRSVYGSLTSESYIYDTIYDMIGSYCDTMGDAAGDAMYTNNIIMNTAITLEDASVFDTEETGTTPVMASQTTTSMSTGGGGGY